MVIRMNGNYKRKTNEDRKKELDALTRQLQQGINYYIASERYTAVLDSMSRFYNYSINNSIIIAIQNPYATHVASYTTWKNMNRSVKKGEKGIQIFCPFQYHVEQEVNKIDPKTDEVMIDKDGNIIKEKKLVQQTGYKIGYVFDVSQTEQIKGKKEYPLEFVDDLKLKVESYNDVLELVKRFSPVPIEFQSFPGNAKGYFSDKKMKIVIQDDLSESQTIKTIIHEIAHAYLHGKNVQEDSSGITFNVDECVEFPSLGVHYENLNLDQAIEIYKDIPAEKIKGISFVLHDNSIYSDMEYPIVVGDEIKISNLNDVDYFKDSFVVQRTVTELQKHFIDDGFELRSTRELQAESVAYMVCNHLGIDTSDYSFGYVATWMKDENQLMDNLDVIKSCSNEIIDGLGVTQNNMIKEEIGIYTTHELAVEINKFSQIADPYEYRDVVECTSSNIQQIESDINLGKTSTIKEYLTGFISDNRNQEYVEKSKQLLKGLKVFEKNESFDLSQIRERGMKR